MMLPTIRRWRRSLAALGCRGAAAVEFAMVTPILLTLSVGGIDYGNLLNGSQAISAAARVAAETARNDPTCQSGIQVLSTPQISTPCKNKIQSAMQTSGNFSPALATATTTLACYCDGDNGSITCGNVSCATTGRGYNEVFITISASQIVSPLITWPFFPDSINGYMTVRLQ